MSYHLELLNSTLGARATGTATKTHAIYIQRQTWPRDSYGTRCPYDYSAWFDILNTGRVQQAMTTKCKRLTIRLLNSSQKADLEVENARLTALENVRNSSVARKMTTAETNYYVSK